MIALVEQQRRYLKITVSLEADAVVEQICQRRDMTKHGTASRIYEWFGRQPEVLQTWILGGTDASLRAAALQQISDHFAALAKSTPDEDIEIDESEPKPLPKRKRGAG
jgi:hypothetical protein